MSFRSSINSTLCAVNPLLGAARRIPWRAWIGAACLGLAAFWLHEHDAQVRQTASLGQSRRETAAEVSSLKKQAAAAVEAANVENARAIAQLKARRQTLERRDQELASQLAALLKDEQTRTAQVATLPTSEVVTRVAAQLGLEAPDFAPVSGAAAAGLKPAPGRNVARGAASSPPAAGAIHESPLPTDAGPAIYDRRPQPGGEDAKIRRSQIAATEAQGGAAAPAENPEEAAGGPEDSLDTGRPTIPALSLSSSGARKVESALVALEACRSRSRLEERQISNCRERAATDAQTIERQADSLGKLNQALAAKDQILARQQLQHQAELRAARGTFWRRLARVSKHVAIGVAVGVALGAAVR